MGNNKSFFLLININISVLIYGRAGDYDSDEDSDSQGGGRRRQTRDEDKLSEGTIIFCCPNAGYYEYMYCDVRKSILI